MLPPIAATAGIAIGAIKGKNKSEIEQLFGNFHDLVTGSGNKEDLGKLAIFEGVNK